MGRKIRNDLTEEELINNMLEIAFTLVFQNKNNLRIEVPFEGKIAVANFQLGEL